MSRLLRGLGLSQRIKGLTPITIRTMQALNSAMLHAEDCCGLESSSEIPQATVGEQKSPCCMHSSIKAFQCCFHLKNIAVIQVASKVTIQVPMLNAP